MHLRTLIATVCLVFSCQALAASSSTDYLHLNWLDKKVDLNQNFYSYANGNWQKRHPIPNAYPSWDMFMVIHERNQDVMKQIIEDAANHGLPGSIEQKVGNFYFSGMNEASINQHGASPLQPEFQRIANIKSQADLQTEIAHLQDIGADALFGFGEMQDFKNSQRVIGVASQGGIGLPDRDYYLKNDKRFVAIRAAYVKHIANMFQLLGDSATVSQQEANTVMTIETNLAKASMSLVEQRDPRAVYHMKTLQELQAITPNFSWQKYFAYFHHPEIQSINLATPNFFVEVNKELANVSLADWKTYLRWQLINAYAGALSKPFVDENFKMTTVLTGTKELLPRWKRVVGAENGGLGFAIGKLYVEKYFPESSKDQVKAMVANIRAALKQDLEHVKWMSPATRDAALNKLNLMEDRVGYPSQWWDYSTLKIDRGPYALNMMRVSEFLTKRELDKIGKPFDKNDWDMTPQTVNAYYDPSSNRLNIPAGILQPPFFDPKAPAAVNYGAIGFVIGHEMTHGFDDEGAQFDAKGNLKNWWTKTDLEKFKAKENHIVKQFSSYAIEGEHVQGKLVVGEATADLGGLILAYHAFHANAFASTQVFEGYTPDQQFFLSAAHVWAMNMRPEEIRHLIVTDEHPPALYRVNGTLANMPEFQRAFHVANTSPMVDKDKIKIW